MLSHPSNPSIQIRHPTTTLDWRHARALILDQPAWVRDASGIDILNDQRHARDELSGLEASFSPPASALLLATMTMFPSAPCACSRLGTPLRRCVASTSDLGRAAADSASDWYRCGLDVAAELGCTRVQLETVRGVMDAAIAIYLRCGFQPTTFESTYDHTGLLQLARTISRERAAA